MSTNLLTVTNRVLLLGLDNLYRSAMKRHESSELLEYAREVTAILKVDSIDVPTEGSRLLNFGIKKFGRPSNIGKDP